MAQAVRRAVAKVDVRASMAAATLDQTVRLSFSHMRDSARAGLLAVRREMSPAWCSTVPTTFRAGALSVSKASSE